MDFEVALSQKCQKSFESLVGIADGWYGVDMSQIEPVTHWRTVILATGVVHYLNHKLAHGMQ